MNWDLFKAITYDYIKEGDFDKALDFQKNYNITDAKLDDMYWKIGDIYFWCSEEYCNEMEKL